jgi:membrane associated rhomboid family serine protease
MFEESPVRESGLAHSRARKAIQAYQVLFAFHCLGFVGLLVAHDSETPLRTLVDGVALGGAPSEVATAPWKLLTYAFVHQQPLEVVVTLTLLLALGAPLERGLGALRFSLLYLGIVGATGLGHEAVEGLWAESRPAADVFLGGLGASAGLLVAYFLAYPSRRTFGVVPAPAFFAGAAVFLFATMMHLEQEGPRRTAELLQSSLSSEQWLDRQWELGARVPAVLPHALGFSCGMVAFALDSVSSRAFARARFRRDIAVLEEELEARARVEQLLEKISRDGISALSRRERKFLQYASRFYPTGDRVS